MRSKTIIAVFTFTALFTMSGCGGGTSQGAPPPPPPPTLSIKTPSVIPSVVQGQTYSLSFQASGGTGALTWTSLDALPAGLALSTGGALSGIPTASGGYSFRVQVQDSGKPAQSAVATENLFVVGALSLSNVTFPNANRGIGYQFGFFPTGGTAPFSFSVTVGNLPAGMSISNYGSGAGQLSGTPLQSGTFPFTMQVTDSGTATLQQTASSQLTIVVDAILQITTIYLPNGIQNRPYAGGLTAVNGTLPLHWSMSSVPQGITLNSTTGALSGTPTQTLTNGPSVTVTDSGSPQQSNTVGVGWSIYGPVQFLGTYLGSIQVGYTGGLFSIPVSGGQPPVTSALISGVLPPGMNFNGAVNLLDGAATQPGNYSIGVQLQDSASPPQTAQATLTFTITPALPVLANSTFPNGIVGIPYGWGAAAKNGQPPFSWSIHAGSLPPGLTLDSLGLISGTPTAAGAYSFYLQVTDSFSPPDTTWSNVIINISASALGRNDSIATATPLTNGNYSATISPYNDPTTNAADSDYYKLSANPGAIVSVSIVAKRLNSSSALDSVAEIVDSSGKRFAACKDPASAYLNPPLTPDPNPNDYNDPCVNDDDPNTGTTDSDLSFQVPGSIGGPLVLFYVHVLDWRGNARPDMEYQIQIAGAN